MEQQLLDEIAYVMRVKGISQTDFATHKGVSRQSVSQFFTGKKSMLTGTARDLLDYLGVRIKLEMIEKE
jgi:transcriptional regulator with XRE-family HTH domain